MPDCMGFHCNSCSEDLQVRCQLLEIAAMELHSSGTMPHQALSSRPAYQGNKLCLLRTTDNRLFQARFEAKPKRILKPGAETILPEVF